MAKLRWGFPGANGQRVSVSTAAQRALRGGATRGRRLGFGAVVVKESRVRGRSWGRFKERFGDLGVRALDRELAGDLGVTGERGMRGG